MSRGRKVCIPVAPSPLSGQPYLTHPAAARMPQLLVGKTGIAHIHTVHTLWVSTLSFQPMAEVNGLAKTDDSKIILVISNVAFVLIDLEWRCLSQDSM